MTVQAKAIVNAYYSSAPKYSYFNGCSLGGRQGITEAQRYPADYDGIVAGAVAWGGMDRYAGVIMTGASMLKTSGAYIPPEKYPAVHDAVSSAPTSTGASRSSSGSGGSRRSIRSAAVARWRRRRPGDRRVGPLPAARGRAARP